MQNPVPACHGFSRNPQSTDPARLAPWAARLAARQPRIERLGKQRGDFRGAQIQKITKKSQLQIIERQAPALGLCNCRRGYFQEFGQIPLGKVAFFKKRSINGHAFTCFCIKGSPFVKFFVR
ncbi:MAG: hypothetical protein VB042_02160 [Victivallaceae bacterium]|nr:hypothetical protein [Victivallaceae bacterium]